MLMRFAAQSTLQAEFWGAKLPFGVHGLCATPATFLQVCPTIIARIRLGFDRTHALPTQSASFAQIPRCLKRQHHLSPIRKTTCLLRIFARPFGGWHLGATKSVNRITLCPGTWKRAEFICEVCGIPSHHRSERISISNVFLRLSFLFIRIVRLFHFRPCSRGHGGGEGLCRRTLRRSRFCKVYVGVALHPPAIAKGKPTPANIKRHGSQQHARMVVIHAPAIACSLSQRSEYARKMS
jgi:hypothetical protein